MSLSKPCACPRCTGVPTANKQWGFDEAAVSGVECLRCGEKIGHAPYDLITTYARFGQMMFRHKACPKDAN